MKHRATAVAALLLAGCGPQPWDGSLEEFLESRPDRFGPPVVEPARHRLQVIYTQIDRDADNLPSFRSYEYRVDAGEYFYPASTVKLPTAAIALEKLERLDIRGLDRESVMLTGKAAAFQTEALLDPSSPTGLPSVAQYISKLLVVSDNDAFNRLYEFVGQRELNEALRAKGYTGTRIVHRLESPLTTEQNRHTNPVRFMRADLVVYQQPARESAVDFTGDQPEPLGVAEIVDGERIEQPKDFSVKNAFPLRELHDTVKAILFPEAMPPERRFDLAADDYRFLRRYMSAYPREAGIGARADGSYYADGYVKFLMYGGSAEEIPDNIRIFNKVGDAYGFLTDAAYIVDFDSGVEFLLAATVYTNANRTFNDDRYEYEEIGFPFLRELGRAVYEIELERERPRRPDLSALRELGRPADEVN